MLHPAKARERMMISDHPQTFRDQAIQQAQARPYAELVIRIVDTFGLGELVGEWVVESDVAGKAPTTLEQVCHMPWRMARCRQSANARQELLAVPNYPD